MKSMKKILSIIVVLAMFLTLLCGCGRLSLDSLRKRDRDQTDTLEEQEESESETQERSSLVSFFNNIFNNETKTENNQNQSITEKNTVVYNTTINNVTTVYSQSSDLGDRPGVDKSAETVETVLSNFAVNENFFVADEETEIVFTVDAADVPEEPVELYSSDGGYVDEMHDDGLNGDAYAGDGVYTAVVSGKHSADVEDYWVEEYWAQCGEETTDRIQLYFFIKPAAGDISAQAEIEEIQTQLNEIQAEHDPDGDGFVDDGDVAAAMKEIEAYLDELKESGEICLYAAEGRSVDIKHKSGLTVVYMLASAETDSLGSDASVTVSTYQPAFTEMGGVSYSTTAYSLPEGVDYVLEMLDVAGEDLEETFDNYAFTVNYDNEAVTLGAIRAFGSNQVILWHGHGYYGAMVKSCLCTGEEFNWGKFRENFEDCVSNRIVHGLLSIGSVAVISAGYIEKYCGDLSNSFVYLAACSSGKDSGLAQAFLDKGAGAVVANTETIIRAYNVAMLYETVENMMTINESTGSYYTLGEALQAAKAVYGASDKAYRGVGAMPVIFGGTAAMNFRFCDAQASEERGTLSGRVCQAYDHSVPISGAAIQIYEGDDLVRSVQTNAAGDYTVELPAGDYRIEVSAAGYITFSAYVSVEAQENAYMETFLMVAGSTEEEDTVTGYICDAQTGEGVAGVKLTICSGWNNQDTENAVTTIETGDGGYYSVQLPLGNYTLNTEKDGYISAAINIVVQHVVQDQDGAISPIVSGDDYRIVLTWGSDPRDLDAHVIGTLSDVCYHVHYRDMSFEVGETTVCELDIDDRNGYGPETITLDASGSGPYYYFVHLYAGEGTLATSEAQVKVYQGDTLRATFNVPTNLADGVYWNVFAISDGEMIVRNTITDAAEVTYAGTAPSMDGYAADTDRYEAEEISESNDNAGINPPEPYENGAEDDAAQEVTPVGENDEAAGTAEMPATDMAEEADAASAEMDEELQKAYEEVLSKWSEAAAAISDGWEFSELSDYYEFEERYPDVNLSVLLENEVSTCGLAYAYLDIDHNGVEELVIGVCEDPDEDEETDEDAAEDADEPEQISARVISIYGYDGENAVELNSDLRGVYQAQIVVYEDGSVWLHSRAGTRSEVYELYVIGESGYEAEQNEDVSMTEEEYRDCTEGKAEAVLFWAEME